MLLQDTHDLRTGSILTDMRGFRWVCVGTTNIPQGIAYVFIREVSGLHGTSKIKDRMWSKTFSQTLTFDDYFANADDFRR
jgi:hypothetical protein